MSPSIAEILNVNSWKYAETILGVFVAASGFGISFINVRRLLKKKRAFSFILLSENVLLTFLGVAYIVRSQHDLAPTNSETNMILKSLKNLKNHEQQMDCNFMKILISYGPFILSVVNSFVSLIINNYIHYQVAEENCRADQENAIRQIDEESFHQCKRGIAYVKKNFKFFAALLQWLVPVFLGASMYSIDVKEKHSLIPGTGSDHKTCLTMLDMTNSNCSIQFVNNTIGWRHNLSGDYFNVTENVEIPNKEVQSVVERVYDIVNSYRARNFSTSNNNVSSLHERYPKFVNKFYDGQCVKMCYVETKTLLVYMFGVIVVSFFIPIVISIVLLTKLQIMDVKNAVRSQVQKELLYNVLFWTPVVLDNFLSLMLCSYDIESNHTSVMTIVANIYQVIKNFLNTKHFNGNNVIPV